MTRADAALTEAAQVVRPTTRRYRPREQTAAPASRRGANQRPSLHRGNDVFAAVLLKLEVDRLVRASLLPPSCKALTSKPLAVRLWR